MSDQNFLNIPEPSEGGWETVEGTYVAITSDQQIAPNSVIKLIKCWCNSDCVTNICKCSKNKVVCTDLCECNKKCENTDSVRYTPDNDVDEEEMFEKMPS